MGPWRALSATQFIDGAWGQRFRLSRHVSLPLVAFSSLLLCPAIPFITYLCFCIDLFAHDRDRNRQKHSSGGEQSGERDAQVAWNRHQALAAPLAPFIFFSQ